MSAPPVSVATDASAPASGTEAGRVEAPGHAVVMCSAPDTAVTVHPLASPRGSASQVPGAAASTATIASRAAAALTGQRQRRPGAAGDRGAAGDLEPRSRRCWLPGCGQRRGRRARRADHGVAPEAFEAAGVVTPPPGVEGAGDDDHPAAGAAFDDDGALIFRSVMPRRQDRVARFPAEGHQFSCAERADGDRIGHPPLRRHRSRHERLQRAGRTVVECNDHRAAAARVALQPRDDGRFDRRRAADDDGPSPPEIVVAGRTGQPAPGQAPRRDLTGRTDLQPRVVLQGPAHEGPGPRRASLPDQDVERDRRGVGQDGRWASIRRPDQAHGQRSRPAPPRPPRHDQVSVDRRCRACMREPADLDAVVLDHHVDDDHPAVRRPTRRAPRSPP